MNRSGIANNTVDLTDCDREPIHIPGSIQPHGALLALDPDTLQILQVAGAVWDLLGVTADDLLGQPLNGRLVSLRPQALLALQQVTPRPMFVFEADVNDAPFNAIAHFSGGLLVLELEPRSPAPAAASVEVVQGMMRRSETASSLTGLLDAVVREVQAVTGYDRVMAYRFEPDDSGHVLAEARSSDAIDSYLDLHYPASDIPVQARSLYVKNWMRCIPDARYVAAPLQPQLNPRTGAPLDLSLSNLRSVSPIHLQYLANMGVRSSMSLSIVIEGRLWGLIACHHYAPLFLDFPVRTACELFAQMASLQIQTRQAADIADDRNRSAAIQAQLILQMSKGDLPHTLLGQEPNLLSFIAADGVAIVSGGEISARGLSPSRAELAVLVDWLDTNMVNGVFATDRLGEVWPGASGLSRPICGVLALAVSRAPRDFVIWFLPELVSTVRWAGDPVKSPETQLTPRTSFALWSETVRGRSRPWTQVEIEGAGMLCIAILEIVLRRLDELVREREAARTHQDLLMAELDHRVKNTLATIQSMVRFSSRSALDLPGFVSSIELRLQSMAKTHNALTQGRWEGASLTGIVDDELRAHRQAGSDQITVEGLDYVLEPKAAMAMSMVLHELTTNAVKHGALSTLYGGLAIRWAPSVRDGEDWLTLHWTERTEHAIAPPLRRGFGRTLLERVFAQDIDGRVTSTFNTTGMAYVLDIPMSRVSQGQGARPAEPKTPAAPDGGQPALAGLRILLVEDAPLVAQDLALQLRAEGAVVIGPFFRLAEALAGAATDIDLALLDVDLDQEPVWPLAEHLRLRGVPLILTTGFSGVVSWPPQFVDGVVVYKPYDMAILRTAITQARPETRH